MLGPRDALIAQLAKSLGLVSDAGLARVTDLKKRFPQRSLEQLLVDARLIDKEGYARLAAAFAAHGRGAAPGASASGRTAKPAPSASTRAPAAREKSPLDSGSEDGLIVPDEEDQRALGRLGAPSRAPANIPHVDPLATPPSEEELTSSSDMTVAEEDAILAEPTLMMRDEELKAPPPRAPGKPARPADAKGPPKPARPAKPPVDEDAILAEPTLMLPDEELRTAPARAKKPEPALELRPSSEEEILAEPTLLVPDDDAPAKPTRAQQEEAILAEPTLMLGDSELGAKPGARAKDEIELDLLPEEPSQPEGSGGFFPGASPVAGAAVAGAGGQLELPNELVAGAAPEEPKGPQPGVKKKAKGGILDRKEFERRSKLRMGFEGMHLGDYEIVGELSRGAFGIVFKVRPESTAKTLARERGFSGEFMAMKVMLETNDPEETRRFMDEVKVLIELVHPNIIRIFDAGVEKGLKFYTMELIDGVDTRTLVREQGGKLPVLYAVRIAKDVASALAVVHAKTIYHRDLKPANVMIDRASQPYRTVLIDFGLVAKKQGDKKDEGLILGTPSYMPPEQAKPKGGFGEVNGTSDIYSLGATFYFLMTGQAPFPGKDPREIIKRVCTEPPPSPVTLNPEIPKSIAAICMKCLAKNQRERYVAARLLEQELERELNAAQLKLKAKGFVRKLFGGGGGGAAPKP